jgi:hypothetical protein
MMGFFLQNIVTKERTTTCAKKTTGLLSLDYQTQSILADVTID